MRNAPKTVKKYKNSYKKGLSNRNFCNILYKRRNIYEEIKGISGHKYNKLFIC
ncbi:hypothetical protein FACS1894172_11210 [Spirochaetia bacterium]|nr:hypothetical protein FACS1894172_11210 [Spirochaetia bacterium]